MKITVTVDTIFQQEERHGANGSFKFRKVWAKDLSNEKYPETLEFTFSGQAIDYPTNVVVGEEVEIDYAISGRQYTKDNKTSVFMSLRAWGIRKVQVAQPEFEQETPSASNYNQPFGGVTQPVENLPLNPAIDLPF